MPIPQVLVHHKGDNVAVVVVEGVGAGQDLFGVCLEDDADFWTRANQDTPIGHKVALSDLAEGQDVIKYGQVIGRLVQPVKAGDHVHTHNLKTKRW
jgi:(2R)-sulfolactate sulfo-lyase subunit alpha